MPATDVAPEQLDAWIAPSTRVKLVALMTADGWRPGYVMRADGWRSEANQPDGLAADQPDDLADDQLEAA
jgi:hypothetical protein